MQSFLAQELLEGEVHALACLAFVEEVLQLGVVFRGDFAQRACCVREVRRGVAKVLRGYLTIVLGSLALARALGDRFFGLRDLRGQSINSLLEALSAGFLFQGDVE